MLPNLFCEASITQIQKSHKDITIKGHEHTQKFLNKI